MSGDQSYGAAGWNCVTKGHLWAACTAHCIACGRSARSIVEAATFVDRPLSSSPRVTIDRLHVDGDDE